MAILKDGINGPFSGKVGSIVGYELNGQGIIRSLPKNIKRPPSALTTLNRNRMKVVSKFLSPIKMIINFGYKNVAPIGSRIGPFQAAQSYHLKNAVDIDNNNNPFLNPEKVLIFRGNLSTPIIKAINKHENVLSISWEIDKYPNNDYSIIAFVYSLDGDGDFYNGGTPTSKGELKWTLYSHLDSSKQVHVYIGVYDIFTGQMSDSVYAGCV